MNRLIQITTLAILLFLSVDVYSQKDTIKKDGPICIESPIYNTNGKVLLEICEDEIEDEIEDVDEIFTMVKMPEYPGGISALRKYVYEHTEYPHKNYSIQGTVYLRFCVEKDGSIGEIEILKGLDSLLDQEAINVIKKLQKFTPGKHNGKNVSVWYSMPVPFKLN